MTSQPLANLSTATLPLSGSELLYCVQSGNDRQVTSRDVTIAPAYGNLTFYVATTGSDSNPGTVGSPFLTIQHAITIASGYHYQGLYKPTINVADGTYTLTASISLLELKGLPGGVNAVLSGNTTTPGNCIIYDPSSFGPFVADGTDSTWTVTGFQTDVPNNVVLASYNYANTAFGVMNFNDRTNGGLMALYRSASGGFLNCNGGTLTWVTNNAFNIADIQNYSQFAVVFSTVNFPATMTWTATNTYVLRYSKYGFFQNTVTGLGTVNSSMVINIDGGSSIITDNAVITDIPTRGSILSDTTSFFVSRVIGLGGFGYQTAVGLPTTTQLPQSGFWGVFKDSSGGGVYLATNDGGVLKKVQLSS